MNTSQLYAEQARNLRAQADTLDLLAALAREHERLESEMMAQRIYFVESPLQQQFFESNNRHKTYDRELIQFKKPRYGSEFDQFGNRELWAYRLDRGHFLSDH